MQYQFHREEVEECLKVFLGILLTGVHQLGQVGELLIAGLLLKPRCVLHPSEKGPFEMGALPRLEVLLSKTTPIEVVDVIAL